VSAVTWTRSDGTYVAIEPSAADVAEHADTLRDWYNLAANAAMMGNTAEMSRDDVLDYWAATGERRARGFLLFKGDELVGDAELRNIADGRAEFSIMIGALHTQGRGLGATFTAMLHVLAFRTLGVNRIYVQPLPENERVQRMELRLGYERDDSPEAKAFADDDRAITMSIGRDRFAEANAAAWREVAVVQSL
jgi:RimJ/RimL family protein N-acetyltransferase